MNHRQILMAYSISTLCLLPVAQHASAAFFVPLGPPLSALSVPTDLSDDGSVVVGTDLAFCCAGYNLVYLEAFRWTSDEGMVGLGYLPGDTYSSAREASADGSVVVGQSHSGDFEDAEAFRWTSDGGMVGLGDLPGGDVSSLATGVSADGSVVVGWSHSGNDEAFRWTSTGGMIGLGDLPGGDVSSQAFGVSADGSVVVGSSHAAEGNEAFRWTSADGMFGLGYLPGGMYQSYALDVSADGAVIVGYSTSSASSREAFRWTSDGGMVGLGDLPGGDVSSLATGVSADGSVIVGWSASASNQEAFVWDATNGMRSLSGVLTGVGVDLTGWRLTSANAISADATTIVGYGVNPSGQYEAWLANVSAVPEPESAIMLLLVIAGCGTAPLRCATCRG